MAGRPKIHPEGTTANDRTRMSLAVRKADGRAGGTVLLSQTCLNAIDRLGRVYGDRSRAVTIERLVGKADARLNPPEQALD